MISKFGIDTSIIKMVVKIKTHLTVYIFIHYKLHHYLSDTLTIFDYKKWKNTQLIDINMHRN